MVELLIALSSLFGLASIGLLAYEAIIFYVGLHIRKTRTSEEAQVWFAEHPLISEVVWRVEANVPQTKWWFFIGCEVIGLAVAFLGLHFAFHIP